MRFRPGGVIKKYDVKGRKVTFRWPRMSDAEGMTRYVNSLIRERPPMLARTVRMTVGAERKHIRNAAKATKEKKLAMFVMEVDGKMACSLHIKKRMPNSSTMSHVVEVGLGLKKEFRGMGLGHTIMEGLEHVSRKYLKAKVITLTCLEYNRIARNLYRKNGYKETGRVPKAIRYKGKYYDEVIMTKVLI